MIDIVDKTSALDQIRNTSLEDLFSSLSTNNKGLGSREAKNRLEKYDFNEIEEKTLSGSFLAISGGQFHS